MGPSLIAQLMGQLASQAEARREALEQGLNNATTAAAVAATQPGSPDSAFGKRFCGSRGPASGRGADRGQGPERASGNVQGILRPENGAAATAARAGVTEWRRSCYTGRDVEWLVSS